jgi:predicted Zn-dependent protease
MLKKQVGLKKYLVKMLKKIFTIFICLNLIFINNIKPSDRSFISIIQDSELQNFIDELMVPIYKVAGVDKQSINIYFVNDSTPNAFVYGGQNIFIHTGLIHFADNFQEIAGVLAHELGHITASHLSRAEIAYANTSLIVTLGLGAILLASIASALANNKIGGTELITIFGGYTLLNTTLNKSLAYSKSEESQADQIAATYLEQTPYSLSGFYDFMYKLYSKEEKNQINNPASWYRTHPLTSVRLTFIENFIKNNPQSITLEQKKQNERLEKLFLNAKAKIIAYNNIKTAYNIYGNLNTPDALYAKAIIAYLQKDYPLAINLFNNILKIDPTNLYINEFLGDIAFDTQNYKEAVKQYTLLTSKSIDYLYTFKLAKAYFAMNNFELALSNINVSLLFNKNNAAAFFLKSLILGALNEIPKANLALAEHYLILQNYEKAKFFLDQIKGSFPKNSIEAIDVEQMYNIINKL